MSIPEEVQLNITRGQFWTLWSLVYDEWDYDSWQYFIEEISWSLDLREFGLIEADVDEWTEYEDIPPEVWDACPEGTYKKHIDCSIVMDELYKQLK